MLFISSSLADDGRVRTMIVVLPMVFFQQLVNVLLEQPALRYLLSC